MAANSSELIDQDGRRSTLFVRDVTKIDCALFDPSQGVLGQSWHVDIWLTGQLDENGFVFDFSPLKALIKQTLMQTVDHSLIIPVGSQAVQFNEREVGEAWRLKSRSRDGDFLWNYSCPKGAVFPVRTVGTKAVLIEQEIARLLRHRLPASVEQLVIKLREESIAPTEASYRYTHGIQGHMGLCQRLFHGHRSRIEIHIGEERRADLEHYIAREVFGTNVHIATLDQIKSGDGQIGQRGKDDAPTTLAFTGSLGSYEATLPSNRIFYVEGETSIEALTREVAKIIKREERPSEPVKAICFEGIDKGAIAII